MKKSGMENRPPDVASSVSRFAPEAASWGAAVVRADVMKFEMMDRAFAAVHGYSVDELLHKPISQVLAPDHLANETAEIHSLCSTSHQTFESKHVHRDGTVFPVLVDLTDLNGNADHLMYRVAGPRDPLRHVLYDKAESLVAAIENAAESVVITDGLGTIEYVNPAFERTTGFSRNEALGKNPRILKSGEHDKAFYGALYDTIGGGRVWHGRFVNRRKDGTLYEEDAVISAITDPSGEILQYVAVKRDVTHEAGLERQLRQAKKLEAIGRLAAGVAHDFNNMMSIVIGNVDLSLLTDPDPESLRQNLEEIRNAGRRAAELARQLLVFSRNQDLQQEVLDLNMIVKDAERMLTRIIGEHIELRTKLDPGLAPVRGDRGQLEQVIVNLALNARDAMPQGGTLTIETAREAWHEESPAEPQGAKGRRHVSVLSVRDTGVGIKAEDLDHIFDPFFTTKNPEVGTGLGLATVHGIARQWNGHIRVESKPGKGATFKLYLPACMDEPKPKRQTEAREEDIGGSETVLVVEDDDFVRALTCKILKRYGYHVLDSGCAESALAVSAGHEGPIGLILTDVVMPGMSAGEMAARIQDVRKETRVLFMSGYAGGDIAVYDGTLQPGSLLIEKPFTPAELARKVRDVLDGPIPGRSPE